MGVRGRKSTAALTIASLAKQVETIERQKPPHDLTDEEVEVWVSVTNSEPADWFSPSTAPLLAQYCRHVIHARRLAELIEKAVADPELSLKNYDRLLKMQDRESRAVAMLATKMRISQQSTTNHRGNKRPSVVKKPWDD